MPANRYQLRREPTEPGLIDELATHHERVGLDGLLRHRGRGVRVGRVPGVDAVDGFRWGPFEQFSQRWWPQGIEVRGPHDELLLVSWFAQPRGRRGSKRHQGVRVTVVDRRDPRHPRAHHVLLVEAVRDGSEIRMDVVPVHAGGIAWVGDRLWVAATHGGFRTFDLRDILRVRGRAPHGYRHVLPQSTSERASGSSGDERMRYSFVSVERTPGGGGPHLIVGEYGDHQRGRVSRMPLTPENAHIDAELVELHTPGIPRMQGAAVIKGRWFITASNGTEAGDLWVGSPTDGWTRHPRALPPGPEDLAASDDGERLWSLSEYPGKRWVFSLNARR
jgi:hypothetical protein